MSNKSSLTEDEKNKSRENLKSFRNIDDNKFNACVKYTKNGTLSKGYNLEVDFEEGVGGRINVYWDKILENYLDLGLFGYYDADYCKMELNGLLMTITQTNGIIITIENMMDN